MPVVTGSGQQCGGIGSGGTSTFVVIVGIIHGFRIAVGWFLGHWSRVDAVVLMLMGCQSTI